MARKKGFHGPHGWVEPEDAPTLEDIAEDIGISAKSLDEMFDDDGVFTGRD